MASEIIETLAKSNGPDAKATTDMKNNAAFYLTVVPGATHEQCQQAIAWAREIVAQKPEIDTYRNSLGVALYRVGEWEEAKSNLESSIQLSGGGGDPTDRFFLAMIEHHQKRIDSAKLMLNDAENWLQQNQSTARHLPSVRAEATELIQGSD